MPLVKDKYALGKARDIVHAVADDDDRRAGLFPVGAEVLLYLPAAGRVEPRGRLIEHEHLRTHRDDARDGYAPLLPARELQRGALEQLLIDAGEARGLTHAAVDLLLG